jgi:hypothetical protein
LACPRSDRRLSRSRKAHKIQFAIAEKTATIGRVEGLIGPHPRKMATACRHPKVRIVSRHDDTEFVECLECGEVFDSEEFRDMEIEDSAETEDVADDS